MYTVQPVTNTIILVQLLTATTQYTVQPVMTIEYMFTACIDVFTITHCI